MLMLVDDEGNRLRGAVIDHDDLELTAVGSLAFQGGEDFVERSGPVPNRDHDAQTRPTAVGGRAHRGTALGPSSCG